MSTAELTTYEAQAITFPETKERLELVAKDCLALTVTDLADKEQAEKIHKELRNVVALRLSIESCRAKLKAPVLERGRMIDATAKELTAIIAPAEKHLSIEEGKVTAEKARIKAEKEAAAKALVQARVDALAAVNCVLPLAIVEGLTEEGYQSKLSEATEAKRVADEKAAAEEAERQRLKAEEAARIKAEQEELAKQRAELDRLKAEQETERKRLQAIADEQAAEAKRLTDIADAKKREAELAQARQEAAEKAQRETEARLAREAEEKRQREAEAAEASRVKAEKAAQRAARKEANRSDREKIIRFSDLVAELELPILKATEATETLLAIVSNFVIEIRGVANDLDAEGE